MVHEIVKVKAQDGRRLILTFRGGERRSVDVASFVTFDGVFEPLRDPEYFAKVRVHPDLRTVVWPNGADLCPDVLYDRSVAADTHAA